jgi:ankyrin repeat protein
MTRQFFEAIRQGDQTAVDKALAAKPALLRARDKLGRSPIMAAAYDGQLRLAERLAARVAAGPGGLSLFEAASVGDVETVRRLVERSRTAAEDRTDDGYTALHLAAWFGRLEVARVLLEHGADPNAVALNESRGTPLHSAVASRHRDVASLLLALGASANVVQHGGWTPLHAAAGHGDDAIASLLLLRGADPTRASDDGRTAIDMATEGGYGALAELLRGSVEA